MSMPPNGSRRQLGSALLASVALAGCGFHLRGQQSYAFERVAVLPDPGGAVAEELRRSFGGAVQVLERGAALTHAQVVLRVPLEVREKAVVGSSASGQVREFQLRLMVQFSLSTPQGRELLRQDSLALQRDFSYDESFALAKEAEEKLLYRDMQTDIVQQILRRVATVRLQP